MDTSNLIMIVALILLILLSSYFSATETAFSSYNRIRMRNREEKGDKKAALVLQLAENYDRLLSTILIGNNIVNISATAIATVLFTRLAGGEYDIEQEQQFPWAKLDEIPEMYFGDIPEPWRGIKDPLNQRLSSIGIGREIEVIAICGGKLTKKRVKIEAAPKHFLTAEPYVNSAFGLEVRDITFELRHYFRMTEKNPGVIVSNVFAGSQASVAGLRPFEIITAVNDKPVFNIKEFQAALAGQSEVRLAVRRLYNDRVVTVKPKSGPRR